MSSDIPESVEGFVPTLNQMGFMTTSLDPYSEAFVSFSARAKRPVLDISAAYGIASIAALKAGARVIANDIDRRHLDILKEKAGKNLESRLTLKQGAFPDKIDFESNSLDAVLACRILHFLDGPAIERGIRKIFTWLAPGGKAFIVGETAYVKTTAPLIPHYEERLKAGKEWPGYFDNIHELCPETRQTLPKTKHFLDPELLKRAFEMRDFTVEKAEIFARPEFPQWLRLDGRESMGLIAVKF